MRTTVPIYDDVLRAARNPAQSECKPLRQVTCKWARNGLLPQRQDAERSGFLVVEVRSDATRITLEMAKQGKA